MSRLRKQAVSAAIYPGVVLGVGTLISLFLITFVLPRFARMYGDGRAAVSGVTAVLLELSHFLHQHSTLLLMFLVVFAMALAAAWRRLDWTGWGAALIRRVPFLDRQWERFRLATLYQSLALLFRGGYTINEALAVSAQLRLGADMSERVQRACAELSQGQLVSKVLAKESLCDGVSASLLAVGERTGSFNTVLTTISQRYSEQFGLFIERGEQSVGAAVAIDGGACRGWDRGSDVHAHL